MENEERIAVKSFLSILIDEIKLIKTKESDERRLLTVSETCKILNIKKTKLYDMVAKKEIAHIKLGAKIMFDKDDIDKFIEVNKVKTVNLNDFNVNNLRGSRYYNKKR
jgi:excisionase family DNA binding protein